MKQSCPQSFLAFTLKLKDALGTRVVLMELRGKTFFDHGFNPNLVRVFRRSFLGLREGEAGKILPV